MTGNFPRLSPLPIKRNMLFQNFAVSHPKPSLFNPLLSLCLICACAISTFAQETLVLEPKENSNGKHVVLISGDEEYRSEESMPMLAKILSQKHGFKCTVIFAWDADGKYIDPNNQKGLRGLSALESADLMLIGTRFRQPDEKQAAYVTNFLNAGKPVIGIRTATHAFNGGQKFGSISYGQFGRKILGEQWVSHHGGHKREGARGVVEKANEMHPVLSSVSDVFAPSDVYGVKHLTDEDIVLLRGAVTKTLDPESKPVEGKKNDPMQALAWVHTYDSPDGKTTGKSVCTTAGASVDFVSEDLRRLIVNSTYWLLEMKVPEKADVAFVDPFYPSFYGFIRDKNWFADADLQPTDFGLGKTPHMKDPPGSPEWNFRPTPNKASKKAD